MLHHDETIHSNLQTFSFNRIIKHKKLYAYVIELSYVHATDAQSTLGSFKRQEFYGAMNDIAKINDAITMFISDNARPNVYWLLHQMVI